MARHGTSPESSSSLPSGGEIATHENFSLVPGSEGLAGQRDDVGVPPEAQPRDTAALLARGERGSQEQEQEQEQERILNVALNSITDFAYVFDRAGRFLYSNEPLLHLLGITLSGIVGKNFFDLDYPPELATRLQNQIQKVFDTQEIVRDETLFTNTEDQSGFYEYIFTPVFDEEGAVERVAGSTRNITRRKQAEQEREGLVLQLEAERSKFAYLIAHSPAFVATLRGPQHVFDLCNPAYLRLIGDREVIGKPVLDALPEMQGQGFVELLDNVFQSAQAHIGTETSVLLQWNLQGPLEERFVDFVYQPMLRADGTVEGIFVHGFDITAQVRARRETEISRHEAEEANRLKDEFLATLSHELRTPLNAILGWANILQSDDLTPQDLARGLDTIERNARAQTRLIEDILDVSRMISGKMRLHAQPLDLSVIIEEAIDTAMPTANSKSIHLERVLAAGEIGVSGDPARLGQIVWNLLSNAIKFTPRGGHVQIVLERHDTHARIIVTDGGMGIASEILPYIFDRFRQADSSSTRAHDGLGLGLAIVKHLVELHSGSVEAHSEGLGKGAMFCVQLPLHGHSDGTTHSAQSPPEDRTPQGQTLPLQGLHVLVVDDQQDTRMVLSMLIEKRGARVTAVGSVVEAIAAVQQLRPDVLLSDIGMPDEDGFSLIKQMRALAPAAGGQTPAAALTAFARVEDRLKALGAGFQAHLSKPIDPVDLTTLLVALSKRPPQSQSIN